MIAVVDYGAGNVCSVMHALEHIGAPSILTREEGEIARADAVILPGVGEASSAMARLREKGLDTLVPALTCPVLGICIGMQLLCRSSEEGDAACLGIFPTDVVRLPDRTANGPLKVPHMGWDTVDTLRGPLFEGIDAQTYVYYVHSYAPRLCDAAIAATDYGMRFSAALARDNFFGTQFHPEKSGAAGSRILRNFLTLK